MGRENRLLVGGIDFGSRRRDVVGASCSNCLVVVCEL